MAYEGSITITDLMDGQPGAEGASVTKATILYWLKTDSTNPSQIDESKQAWSDATGLPNRWTKIIPSYIANGIYYVCLESEITDSEGNKKYVYGAPVVDNGLTDAGANSLEALTTSRATQQHFWFNSSDIGSGTNLIESGAYITDTLIDDFKQGKSGGYVLARSDKLELGRGINKFMTLTGSELAFYRPGSDIKDATLTSSGLTITNGSITLGGAVSDKSSTANGSIALTNSTFTRLINGTSRTLQMAIGGKFGVGADGTLYAANADISGKVTVGAGSNVYTTDDINPLQIGSKNILRGTEEMKTGSKYSWSAGEFYPSSNGGTITWNYDITDSPVPELKKGLKMSITKANTHIGAAQRSLPIKQGPLTLSAWVKGETGDTVRLQPIWSPSAGGSPEETRIWKEFTVPDNKWHKYEHTYTAQYDHSPDKTDQQGGANGGYVLVKSPTVGREFLITGMKLEAGNKATDWSPAPEDMKSIHTIDSTYKPNYSTALNWAKTSQTYSNNGIDTTGVKVGNTVRLGVLINDFTGNPTVYVVGTVTAVDSSSQFTMLGKGLDTTIIDGGNILTNSIGANQIKANAITSSKLTVGAMPTDNLFLGAAMDDRTNFTYNSDTDFTKHFRYYNGSASIHNFTEYAAGIYQDTVTLTSAGNLGIAFARLADEINLDPTANYIITCWAKCSSASLSLAIGLSYYNTSNTWVWRGGTNTTKFNSANTWQKFTLSFKPDADTKAISYCFTVAGGTGSETFTIRECRLEKAGVNQYITDIDSNKGITIKPQSSSGNDYLQINSTAINFYRNNVETLRLEDSNIRVGKIGTNLRNVYITDSAVQIRNNTTVLAEYGDTIKLNNPSGTTVATITGDGINMTAGSIALGNFSVTKTGAITATSGTIAGYTISGTSIDAYEDGAGNIATSTTGLSRLFMSWKTGNVAFGVAKRASTSASWTWPFKVDHNGKLNATGADIEGTIRASALYINGTNYASDVTTISGKATKAQVDDAATKATNYIAIRDSGISIANVDPGSQKQRLVLTSSEVGFYDSDNNKRMYMTKSNVVVGLVSGAHSVFNDAGLYIYDTSNKKRSQVDANGLHVYGTDGSTEVALFGATARIGTASGRRIALESSAISLYNSSNELRFQVTDDWMLLGKKTGTRVTISSDPDNPYIFMADNDNAQLFKVNSTAAIIGNSNSAHINVTSNSAFMSNSPGIDIYSNSSKKIGGLIGYTHQGEDVFEVIGPGGRAKNSIQMYKEGITTLNSTQGLYIPNGILSNKSISVTGTYRTASLAVSNGNLRVGVYYDDGSKWVICIDGSNNDKILMPQAGAVTGTTGNPLYVTSAGLCHRNTSSSKRYKRDISILSDDELNPNRLYDVEVKQFIYRDDYLDADDQRYGKLIPGFIVEELKDIYPISVTYEEDEPENWDSRYLIPPMLKLIQEQKKEIDDLKERLEALEGGNNVYSN